MSPRKEEKIDFMTFPIEVGEEPISSPESRMWAVCLQHAIAGALGLVRSNDHRKYCAQDRYWLIRDKRHCVGSCSWICELLGIDRRHIVNLVIEQRHFLRKHPYRLRSFGRQGNEVDEGL